ncbi:MAG TPA: four helix bundle protein [Anaerolineales bacterium]|nr:four helix bundle protein [Anaerolineales bacterium]
MGNVKVRSYRDLKVWRRAKAFAVEVYRVTEPFPRREQYGLTDQIRRACEILRRCAPQNDMCWQSLVVVLTAPG